MDENLFWSSGHCRFGNEKEEREGVKQDVWGLRGLPGAPKSSSLVPRLPAALPAHPPHRSVLGLLSHHKSGVQNLEAGQHPHLLKSYTFC